MISSIATLTLDTVPTAPFRRCDVLAAGVSDGGLRELCHSGLLLQPFRGVLQRADLPDTLEVRAAAARLRMPSHAVLCRQTAAWLLGIDARSPAQYPDPPTLEYCVPRGREPLRQPGLRCYQTDLTPEDLTEIGGLPCTTATRTAIDLARWSMPGTGLAVLDAMARNQLIVPEELLLRTERWKGHRFIGHARRLIALCDPRAESAGESWLRLRFHDAGFPKPELQISLIDELGVEIRRLDLGYRRRKYAWEYDGEQYHFGPAAEAADRRRRAEIEERWGWTVVGLGKNLVLGPSMTLEYSIGEVLGMEPLIRRRLW